MPQPIDREGVFQVEITNYGLKEMESGAISVALEVRLLAQWTPDTQTWEPWADFDMQAFGDVWIVKKDGKINQAAADSLIKHAGWDGDFASLVSESWKPTACQVTIKAEEYNGATHFRIKFVNAFDRTPGQMGNVGEDKAKDLNTRFGGQLRALAGNAKRGSAPTSGRPAAPPRPAPPAPAAVGAASKNGEDIPY